MPSVSFQNFEVQPVVKFRKKLKQFIPFVFSEYSHVLSSLVIIFCSDEHLLSLNQQFLKHDYYTDILTFDLSTDETKTGEIYISIDRVKENAKNNKHSFQEEILRVIFHGVLHLCGFFDETSVQKKLMTQKEDETILKFAEFHVKQ